MKERLKAVDYQSQPWKNGGGVTTQLLIWPRSAQFPDDAFLWRVSSAVVSTAGPFSVFPGYDRLLCVWEGAGLLLSGQPLHQGEWLRFAGDVPMSGAPLSGPVKDLNVIYRRGLICAECRTLELHAQTLLASPLHHETLALIGARGSFELDGLTIGAGETLLLNGEEGELELALRPLTPATALFVLSLKELDQAATPS